jgi:imidazolonepropionase-like amidohydrolase
MKRLLMLAAIGRSLILSVTLTPLLSAQERAVAFVDVTVVPMDKEQILPHQTVVTEGGRITQVGSAATVKVPRDALKIDGKGKFLMPGLADMHVHFMLLAFARKPPPSTSSDPSLQTRPTSASSDYARQNQARALLYVANGLTTVRNMWGDPVIDALAKEIDSGSVLGPHIYSVGPLTDGNPPVWEGSRIVETRDQAEEAVRSDKQAGYIAIKVYNRLSKDAYEAIIAAARRQGLPVVGHVPIAVGLPEAIAARQDSIEHLTGFWQALQPDDSGSQKKSSSELLEQADLKKLPALVQIIEAAGIWNCPTLALHIAPRTDAPWLEEEKLIPPDVLEPSKRMYEGSKSAKDSPKGHALDLAIVAALHSGGAHLLLGTDAVKAGTLPGFSLHDELAYFVAAGMTPYEAIRAGTSDAAKFLRRENEFGVVATGRRADLLLVEANPLEDVKNVSKRAGVMVNGHWFTEEELKQRLAALRASDQH